MSYSGQRLNFRARDLWITAATSIPLGMIVMLIVADPVMGTALEYKHSILFVLEIGWFLGPAGAFGGGVAFLLAQRRLYVRSPWVLVALVALGSGIMIWLIAVVVVLNRDNFDFSPHPYPIGQVPGIVAGLLVPSVLAGGIPAALAFGSLTWFRSKVPPPPGTELGARRDLPPEVNPTDWYRT
jgi:hypothetical protein